MCHGRLRRDERIREVRDERLWDLFLRETERPAPPERVGEPEPRSDREEVTAGASRPARGVR